MSIGIEVCSERINKSGIWWQASRNYGDAEAFECKQAVKIRDRLGSGNNGGIPLWAELKSLIGVAVESKTGTKVFFAVHTRANTKFNEHLILKSLGLDKLTSEIQVVFDEDTNLGSAEKAKELSVNKELKIRKSKSFGLVNPFNVDLVFKELLDVNVRIEDINQVFDESLKLRGGFPDTVMSNLGYRRLAFEMHPADLINAVKNLSKKTIVTKIAEYCPV